MQKAATMGRDELLTFGTSFGKFTKTDNFRLHITALDYLAPYAKASSKALYRCSSGHITACIFNILLVYVFFIHMYYAWYQHISSYLHVIYIVNTCFPAQFKVWVKSSAEQQFLYGHHIMKNGLGRITEGVEQYQGVVVYSMSDVPLVSVDKVSRGLSIDLFNVLL